MRGTGQHQPLDARRHVWLASSRSWADWDLLDQHYAEPAAVGRDRAMHREQSPGDWRAAGQRRVGAGHGDVAILIWRAGELWQARRVIAREWRIRRGRQSDAGCAGHRGIAEAAPGRLLERLGPGGGSGCNGGDVVAWQRDAPDRARFAARN